MGIFVSGPSRAYSVRAGEQQRLQVWRLVLVLPAEPVLPVRKDELAHLDVLLAVEPERRAQRVLEPRGVPQLEPVVAVQEALDVVWARERRGPIAQSVALHAVAWGLGAAEIWIVLACIGVEVSLTEVLVLESLSQAIKSAAFAVPSGLGVQEGGFVVVGALFGLDAGTAIALSLAKRVPDVALGLPSLIVWQTLEAKRAQVLPPR